MKLIMENWRKYVAKVNNDDSYGHIYLFEENNIKTVSFSQRFNSLNESEGDLKLFLEEWEKSAIYQLENLEEAAGADPVTQVSTQAWMLLQKGKEGAQKVLGLLPKMKDTVNKQTQKNPKLAKAAQFGLAALAAGALGVWVTGGGDPTMLADMAQQISAMVPEMANDAKELAANFSPDAAADFATDAQEKAVQWVEQGEDAQGREFTTTITQGTTGEFRASAMKDLGSLATSFVQPAEKMKALERLARLREFVPALENIPLEDFDNYQKWDKERAMDVYNQIKDFDDKIDRLTRAQDAIGAGTMSPEEAREMQKSIQADMMAQAQTQGHPIGGSAEARMARDPAFRKAVEDAGGLEAVMAGGEGAGGAIDTTPPGDGKRGAEFVKKLFQRRRK